MESMTSSVYSHIKVLCTLILKKVACHNFNPILFNELLFIFLPNGNMLLDETQNQKDFMLKSQLPSFESEQQNSKNWIDSYALAYYAL